MTTLTKSLFTWKTAGILTGVKLATLAAVLGLARAGLLPSGFRIGVSPLQDLSPILLAGSELPNCIKKPPQKAEVLGLMKP